MTRVIELVDTKDGVIDIAEHIVDVRGRLERLEAKCGNSLESMQRLEMLEEQDKHADRWHATRDAVLSATLNEIVETVTDDPVDYRLQKACEYADRAHGPLEVVDAPPQMSYALETIQLVRAARQTVQGVPPGEAMVLLVDALKPFESVR